MTRSERDVVLPRRPGERFTPGGPALVLAAVGGLGFMAAFPPYDLWPLLPLSIALLLIASFVQLRATAALSGFVFGICAFLPLFAWANIYAGTAPWVALAAVESLFPMLFAAAARSVLLRLGIGLRSGLLLALLWAALELLRARFPWGGLPWGASAFALAKSPLLNFGPWIGTVGLAIVVGLLGALLAGAILSATLRRRENGTPLSAVWPAASALLIILIAMLTPLAPVRQSADTSLQVLAVQGNVTPPPPGSYYLPKEMFANHLAASQAGLTSTAEPDVVIWPEDSTGWDAPADPDRMEALAALAGTAKAPVLVGTQIPTGAGNRLNEAILVDDSGTITHRYAKRHPVPFGEYIPLRDFFGAITDKVDLVKTDMLPGTEIGVMPINGSRMGVLICFEIAYESLVADTVVDGRAQMLVVQSNNALFGTSNESAQQLAEAKVFAVVSGRSVVHLSTVGHSAVIGPDGRVLDELDHWTAGTMLVDVPLRSGITPAMRFHNAYAWGTGILAVGGLLLTLRRSVCIDQHPSTAGRNSTGTRDRSRAGSSRRGAVHSRPRRSRS